MTTTEAPPASSQAGDRRPAGSHVLAIASGLAAGTLTIGAAELVAGLVAPQSTPVIAVGRAFVERTPGWLKDLAVERFGTHDKVVLLGGVAVVVAVLSAAAGLLALRDRRLGFGLVIVLDAVALAAAATRPDADLLAGLPTLVGAAAGLVAFGLLSGQVRRPDRAAPGSSGASRRRVLTLLSLVGVAGAGIVTGVAGRRFATRAAGLGPAEVTLPAPADAAPELPAGTRLAVPGLTPFVTPTADFYRIDTALLVPRIDANTWSLRLHGLVDREVTLTYADLVALPLVERLVTLTCVSNEVGGTLAGNALWRGYPLAALLARAGVRPEADMVLSSSADGFTVSTPLAALTDGRDALLAVGMNGSPLPIEHGFPVRMVVPGLYGYVSATKWVVDLEVTRFDRAQAYWTQRGYAAQAPVRTSSRIDVPRPFARVSAGPVAVAGVAWAQHRGIAAVQVRVDGGAWQPARLAGGAGAQTALRDMWRQWVWEWDAAPGTHLLEVRAMDGDGQLQPQARRRPAPDGATGWHSVSVTVT